MGVESQYPKRKETSSRLRRVGGKLFCFFEKVPGTRKELIGLRLGLPQALKVSLIWRIHA
eukprot:1392313-Amorphochlora_amoeboformis.AAC.1